MSVNLDRISLPSESIFAASNAVDYRYDTVASSIKIDQFVKRSASKADFRISFRSYDYVKRIFDLVGATLLLVCLAPLLLAVGVLVRITSRGPAIYTQKRLTRAGEVFKIYKFRTMTNDAEKHTGPVWASCSDARITNLGRFLRKTRIDELPQLINILKGEMTFIGPRPERPEVSQDLARIFPNFYERLYVKAGLTGLSQVKVGYAASEDEYKKKLELDVEYISKRSFLFDFYIALLTVRVMLTGSGAR